MHWPYATPPALPWPSQLPGRRVLADPAMGRELGTVPHVLRDAAATKSALAQSRTALLTM